MFVYFILSWSCLVKLLYYDTCCCFSHIFAIRLLQKSIRIIQCDTFIMTDIIKRICKWNSTREETALQKCSIHLFWLEVSFNYKLFILFESWPEWPTNYWDKLTSISCWTRFNTFITFQVVKNFLYWMLVVRKNGKKKFPSKMLNNI